MVAVGSRYKDGIAYGMWAGWLFGFGGLHRLYLGKYGTGFIWLFTWGLFGVGQLYDLVTLLSLSGTACAAASLEFLSKLEEHRSEAHKAEDDA